MLYLCLRPLFLFARHSDNKFYEDFWYLYPEKPQNCDWNILLRKVIILKTNF